MKRTVWHALALVVCGLAVFALPALADSQVRIVRLSYLSGSVQIDRNSGQGFEKAIMNMPVTAGTQLKTENGQAEIEFENGSTVRLTPETLVSLDGLSLLANGSKVSLITLQHGVAYFNLNRKDHNDFKVQVAGRDIDPGKSAHFRAEVARNQVRLAVFNGELKIAGPGKNLTVHKNETFSFDPENESQYSLAKGIDEYRFDAWDSQRDQYQSQYARASYVGEGGAPYYGWDDLNYYGSYSYFPGYGFMWRPYGVGYGWDPFAVGYWMSYPWGYTWVSPYAWGWTPYRYGGWQFVSGSGWFWRPGPWRNWHSVPPMIGAPPYYRAPRPPSGAFGGVVAIGHPHPPAAAPVFGSVVERNNSGGHISRVVPLPTPNIGPTMGTMGVGTMTDVPRSGPDRRFTESAPARGAMRMPPPSPPQRSDAPPQSAGTGGRSMGMTGGAGSMGASRGSMGGSIMGGSSMHGGYSGGHSEGGGHAGGRGPH